VLGDGKLGLLCAQVLRLTGARVSAVGRHPEKLAILKKLGIRTFVLGDWKPRLYDVAVEAVAHAGRPGALKVLLRT